MMVIDQPDGCQTGRPRGYGDFPSGFAGSDRAASSKRYTKNPLTAVALAKAVNRTVRARPRPRFHTT
jgi:hypothetical protein